MSSGPPSGHGFRRPDEPAIDIPGRGDRPNRKQFGPDAKPFRSRNQRTFKPESGKKALKEKFSGQLYSVDDEEDPGAEPEIDNFATSVEDEHSEENRRDTAKGHGAAEDN